MAGKHWAVESLLLLMLIGILLACAKFAFGKYIDPADTRYYGLDDKIDWEKVLRIKAKIQLKCEEACRDHFELKFGKPFPKIRPDWLTNPQTGRKLELDGYNNQLKIAFEYDGVQHRKFSPFFHRSPGDFENQIRRDRVKSYACKQRGVCLIRIPDTVPFGKIGEYIDEKLSENGY